MSEPIEVTTTQPSIDALRSLLRYDAESGNLFWRHDVRRGCGSGYVFKAAGSLAGGLDVSGYVVIYINRKAIKAHRIAYAFEFGVWPSFHIDHINHVRSDNRISNLRDVPRKINSQNKISAHVNNKSSGLLGAHFDKCRGKYKSEIGVDGRIKTLGYFDDAVDAHHAYVEAKRVLHEGNTL